VKLNRASYLRRLTDTFPRAGRLEWIGVRPAKRAEMIAGAEAEAVAERGITGDYRTARGGSRRQVTLIQAEHLEVIGELLGRDAVDPRLARRNLVVSGINVLALKDQRFAVGNAILEGTGPCEPCSKMEAALGDGGYNAMRGHGGITARIVVGGVLRLGDAVRACESDA
jgi:MOSC domain-containing protein YiiM